MKFKLKSLITSTLFVVVSIINSNAQTPLFKRVLVSDVGSNNNIGNANTSRNLAITEDGTIYAVFVGSEGIRVAKSIDRGQSFLPSVQVSNIQSTEPEIAVNSSGVIFVSWVQSTNLFFREV